MYLYMGIRREAEGHHWGPHKKDCFPRVAHESPGVPPWVPRDPHGSRAPLGSCGGAMDFHKPSHSKQTVYIIMSILEYKKLREHIKKNNKYTNMKIKVKKICCICIYTTENI